ncbi:MAG TPA: VOC family protein [Longimicrobiaceae bacterium]|nr:VOC family protein [Longimicrobiaceae bacterium]
MSTADPTTFALREIGQIAVPVADLDRAIAFYGDVLGMHFLFRAPPGLAFFDCGGIRLMLNVPEGGEDSADGPVIYYRVANLPAAVEALRARGARFESDPQLIARLPDHELWMAFLEDPDGNLLGLMSEVRE